MNINDFVSDPYPLFDKDRKKGKVSELADLTNSKGIDELINYIEKEQGKNEAIKDNMQQVKADEGREPGDD